MSITTKKQTEFLESAEGKQAKEMLIAMDNDDRYDTQSSYTADSTAYPDMQMPFVDRHLHYMSCHLSLDPLHYISNLRIKTRIR